MKSALSSVSILIKGRRAAREFQHQGATFIEGRPGSEFEVEVTNHTSGRVMAIISIDGLSVINGDPASQDSPGYVLNPFQTIRIPGWKLNSSEAAKFTFSGRKESYSQLSTGESRNCGVIGVMCWSEKPQPVQAAVMQETLPSPWFLKGASGAMANAATPRRVESTTFGATAQAASVSLSADVGASNLGTGFGEATNFQTRSVEFQKDRIIDTVVMYYDDARGLTARGIVLEKPSRERYSTTPDPFPGMSCTPPTGWKR